MDNTVNIIYFTPQFIGQAIAIDVHQHVGGMVIRTVYTKTRLDASLIHICYIVGLIYKLIVFVLHSQAKGYSSTYTVTHIIEVPLSIVQKTVTGVQVDTSVWVDKIRQAVTVHVHPTTACLIEA